MYKRQVNIWVNRNEGTGKCSENINNADKLKENDLNQVSSSDSGDNDDDTFTDNSVSLSTDEIIDDEINNDSVNIWVNRNEDTGKCSENINNADKLKENDLQQVSSSDSGGNNKDDIFTNNCVTLSAVETKNEVCEVNTNNIREEVSLNVKQVAINMVSNNVCCDDVNKSCLLYTS